MSDVYEDELEEDEIDQDEPESTDPVDDGEGEFEISFDGEEIQTRADESPTIRQMRQKIEEQARELAKRPTPVEKPIDIGPKPTLEGCDYDEAKFEGELDAWKDRERQAANQGEQQRQQAQQHEQAWQADVTRLQTARAALKAPDFDTSDAIVGSALTQIQLACITTACDDAAKVIYALGKSPARLAELTKITNPVKFTAAVAKMEGKITMKPRKTGIEPDEPVRGSARLVKGVDKREAELEAKADKSGDRSELVAYRSQKKSSKRR